MFKENVPLAEFSSYKIGGPARYFFEAKTADELKRAIGEAQKRNLDFFVLGGGTNILIGDEGFPGLVIKPSLNFTEVSGNKISAGAGALVSDLLDFSVRHGLGGMEWAGGLPGTVGGAVRGNAGAFGGEIKDTVKIVRSLDAETLREIERNFSDCGFDYRSSIFKSPSNKEIILSADFGLGKGDPEEIKKKINEKILYRRERHPMEHPNAGSVFENVDVRKIPQNMMGLFTPSVKTDPFPVVPAAFIISEAGLKGVSSGGAMISSKHPNFIVNVLDAKASDVKNLVNLVKSEVKNKFGIDLREEIMFI